MMKAAHFNPLPSSHSSNTFQEITQREEDTQEVASFLLSLKHRSVTPEPQTDDSERLQAQTHEAPPPPPAPPAPQPTQEQYHLYSHLSSFECEKSSDQHIARPQTVVVTRAVTGGPIPPLKVLRDDSKLVFMKDRDLVPDSLFVAMAQMKPCRLTQADRVGCYKSRDLGFVGMCCKHCGGQPGFGRYYPNSVRSLAQTTTSQTILKHVAYKCRFCPPEVRAAVHELQRQQAVAEGLASGRPRYGSRKIFFQRVWSRLHGKPSHEDSLKEDGACSETQSDFDETGSSTASGHSSDDLGCDVRTSQKRKQRSVSDTSHPTKRAKRSMALPVE